MPPLRADTPYSDLILGEYYFFLRKQKVLNVEDSAADIEKAKQERSKTRKIERRKSNLRLHFGANRDELDESRTCPICLCEYENGEQICWSNNRQCAHHFHSQCGIAWLAKHSECPICRAEYLVEPAAGEEDAKTNDNTPSQASGASPSCTGQSITMIEEEEGEHSDDHVDSQVPRGDDAV